jgi:RNA polymerase sigma factor (sigma-70 family)
VSAESQKKRIAELAGREWRNLVRTVRSWIDDAADRDAEDIVQDVMAGLFERADPTAPIADLTAYLYRSVRNRVVDAYRRRRPSLPLADETPDPEPDVALALERAEELELLHAAIDRLPAAQREVLVATELEGRTFRELAAEWGVPIGTLLARKHRAMRALKQRMGGVA